MDFIRECFEEHGQELIDELETVGFSVNQAIDFLPEAASGIAGSTRAAGIVQSLDNLLTDDSTQLLSSIDMQEIVRKSGINCAQATSGFKTIVPFFVKHFQNNMLARLT